LNNVTATVNETIQTVKIDFQLLANSTPMISVPIYLMIARAKTTVDPAITKRSSENNMAMSTT